MRVEEQGVPARCRAAGTGPGLDVTEKHWVLQSPVAICKDVDGARAYYAKLNKSIKERQITHDLTHL